ncbi:MAG: hypothetical protein SH850_21630 [Planctomycetaceae bacterium]|nr:hypothetical protein [Planctomycetaceae bacterium]
MASERNPVARLIPAALLVGMVVAIPAGLLIALAGHAVTSDPQFAARMALAGGLALLFAVTLSAWFSMLREFQSERNRAPLDFDSDHRY